jgi:NADH:ubiquinone reductase (H+-translocating)
MKNIVILGAGYAGLLAALRLSHTTRKTQTAQITLVNAADTFVERIRLHEVAANHPPQTHRIQAMIRGTGIRFMQGWVTGIHTDTKTVEVHTSDKGSESLSYDKLVYALGSSVDRSAVAGVRDYAYTLDSHSAPLLAQRMKSIAQKNGKVVVIGGGLTGIESATELAEAFPDVQVTLLTQGALAENLSSAAQDYISKTFAEMNIKVLEQVTVAKVTERNVQLTDGSTLASDATVWAAGFKPSTLAKEAGLAVNSIGQIIVDPYLRSISHADVYAAGDALTFEGNAPLAMRMSCQIAMPLGSHVADNLAAWLQNKPEQSFRFGYSVQCISLGQKRGLVQMIHPDDNMKPQIITGWMGWAAKRLILKGTFWALQLERLTRAYTWIKTLNLSQTEPVRQPVADNY